jgi:hypothetical protein
MEATYRYLGHAEQSHVRVYRDFQDILELHSLSDRLPMKFDFEAVLKVVIPKRAALEERCSMLKKRACGNRNM